MNIITSISEAVSGSDVVFDIANALTSGSTFIPGNLWPSKIVVLSSGGIAMAAALEYVNTGLGTPTSTYDGIASGTSLTSATMAGAYLLEASSGYSATIYVAPYPVQMKTNLKVHVWGASGSALVTVGRQ